MTASLVRTQKPVNQNLWVWAWSHQSVVRPELLTVDSGPLKDPLRKVLIALCVLSH